MGRRSVLLVVFAVYICLEVVSASTPCTNQTVERCTLPKIPPTHVSMRELNKCCRRIPQYGKCLNAIHCTAKDSGYEAWRAAKSMYDAMTYACSPESKKVFVANQVCFYKNINETVDSCVNNTHYGHSLCTYFNALLQCQYKKLADKCNKAIAKEYAGAFAMGLTPYLPAGCTVKPTGKK